MARKKKQLPVLEQVTITDVAAEGKAIARVNEMVVFVPFVAPGDVVDIHEVNKHLTELLYERCSVNFVRSTFRVQGDTLDIFPAHYEDRAWRVSFFGDEIEEIYEFDVLTGKKTKSVENTLFRARKKLKARLNALK